MNFQYLVVAINGSSPAEYAEHLSHIGADGWECFHIESGLAYFKRGRAGVMVSIDRTGRPERREA